MTQISGSDQYPRRLVGKVVVVTGAAKGQGAAEAAALQQAGATVIGTDAQPEGSECRRIDVSREADWAELAAELKETHGQVHGLVNNAGIIQRDRIDSGRQPLRLVNTTQGVYEVEGEHAVPRS
ncbi:NAD(P)-dependent dehydrogenase (short-subunit alcohol dehydrogenase family) [Streptomyces sp. SAI-127]|jgi:3alpha(or 20beta)-hydroxysteroid dehydrogenase|nr:NAD(P)-dependent dehydrogenase (short-subunit alcohol dehydrogenase family) [Streptomyces sp. SAI-127]